MSGACWKIALQCFAMLCRRHPSIAGLVSNLFYAGRLLTPSSVTQELQEQVKKVLFLRSAKPKKGGPCCGWMSKEEKRRQ